LALVKRKDLLLMPAQQVVHAHVSKDGEYKFTLQLSNSLPAGLANLLPHKDCDGFMHDGEPSCTTLRSTQELY